MKEHSRIFITNHEKMPGLAFVNRLQKLGFTSLILKTPSELNLLDQHAVSLFFRKEKPDYVFLTSIKSGGIQANIGSPGEFLYDNLQAQSNVINCSKKSEVKKLLFVASSCVYPRDCAQPMKERYLLTGPLEPTNEPYAIAKIAGIKMCQAYNRQYGTNFVSLIPATVFGPDDNFDSSTSHVIAALIQKFHEAKVKKKAEITVWGSGKPRREFIYADDLAEASIYLMRHNNSIDLVNVGVGIDVSIRQLAQSIKKIVGFTGKVIFDTTKPDGVMRKLLDISYLKSLGWKAKTDLEQGLTYTYRWYKEKKRE